MRTVGGLRKSRPCSWPITWRGERCVYLNGVITDIRKQNFILLKEEAGMSMSALKGVFIGNLEMDKLK